MENNPSLNIIHLDARQDRRISFMSQIIEQKISAKIWPGIVVQGKPHTGISRAYKQVVRHAKENRLPYCVIADDDFKFTSKNSWRHYLANMPMDFDIYHGGISGGEVQDWWNYLNEPNVKPCHAWSGTFFFTVHSRFYDIFLAADEDVNIDRWLSGRGLPTIERMLHDSHLFRKPVYKVCYPMPVICIDSYSDNSFKNMVHDQYFNQYEKYGG